VWTGINYTLPANVEQLYLSGNVNGTGNSLNNVIVGYGNGTNTIDGGAGVDVLTGGGGNDNFVFHRGEANGDTITDFMGNGETGDHLTFVGYGPASKGGTNPSGATLTEVDATHWSINSADGLTHDIITIANGVHLHANDYLFA
jgi:Ca2+-binding RTX toxin-like protein